MTLINKLNANIFLYTGMILVILNAIFLDFNFFINILGLALVSFSSNITKIIGNFLKDNHQLIVFFSECLCGMATVFLTNFIRCRTSFRMLFRLSLTMSLLGCDDLRQELTIKVRLPRQRQHIRAHYQGFAAPISGYGNQPVSRSQVYRATEGGSTK